MFQSRTTYLAVVPLKEVGRGVFAEELAQDLASLPHLLHRMRREQIEVDAVNLDGVFAVVAFRPLLRVANGTYGAQVSAGYEIGFRLVLNEVRERHIRRVGMMCMPPHDQRESAYTAGPQEVRIGGGLSATFRKALMNGTQFVHMIRLVGTRTGVQE